MVTPSLQGAVYLTHINEPDALTWIAGVLAVVSGVALVAGFLTPASGAVAGLTTLFIVATRTPPSASELIADVAALILVVYAAALSLLGPGALSMDARLFGRPQKSSFSTIPRFNTRCTNESMRTLRSYPAHPSGVQRASCRSPTRCRSPIPSSNRFD